MMSRRGFPSTLGAMGDPDLRGDAEGPRAHLPARGAVRQHGPERAARGARRRGHRRRDPLHDRRPAVGGRARRPRAEPGLHAAYNRWICEFCAGEPRLVPTAHLSLRDPVAAAAGAGAGRRRGRQGRATSRRSPTTARPLGHPDNDPVFAAAQDLDVPFAIHPTFEPQWTKGTRMGTWENVQAAAAARVGRRRPTACATSSRPCSTTACSTSSRSSKVLVLESGGGWIGYWLDRIDAVYGHTFIGDARAARAQAERLLPRARLDLLRSRRAHDPGARRALRRRPVPVGVGLPARRPHARVRRRPRRARGRVPATTSSADSSATTPGRSSTSTSDRGGLRSRFRQSHDRRSSPGADVPIGRAWTGVSAGRETGPGPGLAD